MDNADTHLGTASQDRAARVQCVIEDYIHRRLLGEQASNEQVLADHPDLADDLRPRLEMLGQIERARRLAEGKPTLKAEVVVDESFDTKSVSRNDGSTSAPQVRAFPTADHSAPALQALLSRYDVVKEVARGGMGIVYLGRHKVLDRQVALKVLSPGTSNERFVHEARVMASLRSPHVVTVHDFEVLPDRQAVIAMEWMDGGDLAGLIRARGGRLSEREAHSIMLHVCQGMEAAAERGVIHRDLKPSNILLDTLCNARVADFGLARGLPGVADLTHSGQMMGTPHYMAPEQAENPKGVDTRSDVYSFGATFYHALAGSPPFDGPTPFSVLFKHKTEEPRPLHEANPSLSRRICHIISRCLKKEPDRRYDSFAALRQSLLSGYAADPGGRTTISQEVIDHYYERREVYLNRPDELKSPDVYHFPDRRPPGFVRVLCGNIVDVAVDAILSPDTTSLSMDYGIAKDIRNAAGDEISFEVQRIAPLSLGRVVVTESGGLQTCKYIFHAAVRSVDGWMPSEVIEEMTTNAFSHATSLGIESLAIPIFPLVPHDPLSKGGCLDILFAHLINLMLTRPSSVREVTIVRPHRAVM